MALKPLRDDTHQDGRFYFNMVAERGGIASYNPTGIVGPGSGTIPSGTGANLAGTSTRVASYAPNASGQVPIGILTADCVSLDLTKYHLNFNKVQFPSGGKAPISKRDWFVTNMTSGTVVPGPAYLANNGLASSTQVNAAYPQVGVFQNYPDEDGYVTLLLKV